MSQWHDRLRAAGFHLGLSLLAAALAAALVFGIWYPYPYREISGGRELFLLVASVDVVVGPLITLVIFNRAKPARELLLDFSAVGLLQIGALAYGLWTVSVARPVHLVFEYDRFRVVHAIDVPVDELPAAPTDLRVLPWTGPTVLSLREMRNPDEQYQMTVQALGGVPLAARPGLWQTYEAAQARVLQAARPLDALKTRFPAQGAEIDRAIAATGVAETALAFLPLAGRKSFWTVLIDRRTARPLAYLPLDSF